MERPFNCPVHDDANASASVNVDKGVWYCFSCGARGRARDKRKAPSPSYMLSVLTGEADPVVYPERWLDVFDVVRTSPYWAERVGEQVAARHRCGTHPDDGSPTYPVRGPKGEVWGVVTRRVTDDGPKYRYPFDVSTSRTMFGYHRARPGGVVVVCEGAPDVMAVEQALPADVGDVHALGVYGAGTHLPQVVLLTRLRPALVVACFDADLAGHKAAARLAVTAADHRWPFVSVDWSTVGCKDAAEAPISQRRRLVLAAIGKRQERRP